MIEIEPIKTVRNIYREPSSDDKLAYWRDVMRTRMICFFTFLAGVGGVALCLHLIFKITAENPHSQLDLLFVVGMAVSAMAGMVSFCIFADTFCSSGPKNIRDRVEEEVIPKKEIRIEGKVQIDGKEVTLTEPLIIEFNETK